VLATAGAPTIRGAANADPGQLANIRRLDFDCLRRPVDRLVQLYVNAPAFVKSVAGRVQAAMMTPHYEPDRRQFEMPDEADQDLPAVSAQDFEAIVSRGLSRVQPMLATAGAPTIRGAANADTGASDWSPKIRPLS
jgi:hypothetical protein